MHTKIFSATTIGIETHIVEVEVDLSFGLLQFFIVGLPDTAIKESRQRILTSLKNCGVRLPERKITVNLAPADIKKEGTLFDLPIALGIMHAASMIEIPAKFLEETIILGELSLDGTIKPVNGVLPIAYDAKNRLNKKRLIIPEFNSKEAALIKDIEVIGVSSLTQLVAYLRKEISITPTTTNIEDFEAISNPENLNFDQVKGQHQTKRALQIAAAGRHNILFIGSPGSGKTMLSKRLPTIMPKMSFDEVIDTSKIYSISGRLGSKHLVTDRPFRAPHHTISQAGLVGGGSFPQPGEISLSNNGILFLDELTEFKREVLETLRQPLENHSVCISRALQTITFPASFLLIAALNPCPCGFWGDKKRECKCNLQQIGKYFSKISGPLLDRIDLQIVIPSVDYEMVASKDTNNTSSQDLYKSVERAVEIQRKRFGDKPNWNAYMSSDQVDKFCILTPSAQDLIKKVFDKFGFTMRGYHKLLKVARTIADFEESQDIDLKHIQEALLYRSLDQNIEKLRAQ